MRDDVAAVRFRAPAASSARCAASSGGARRLRVVIGRIGGEAGRVELLLVLRLLEQRQLVRLGRERARLAQLLGARAPTARLIERGARERHLRVAPRAASPRRRRAAPGPRLASRGSSGSGSMRATTAPGCDGVAGVELAAQQPPGRRRRDHEAIAHARLAFLVDRDAQLAARTTGATSTGTGSGRNSSQAARRARRRRSAGDARSRRRVRVTRPSLPRLQHGDEVEPVEPPAHQPARGDRGDAARSRRRTGSERPIHDSGMRNSSHW